MRLNGFNYLDEPAEYKGSKSLLPEMFPMGKRLYYVALSKQKTEKEIAKHSLILDEKTEKEIEKEEIKDYKLMIIATGDECTKVSIGDFVVPDAGFLETSVGRKLESGAEFYVGKEPYIESIIRPENS